jgi:hypothetical protein
MIDLESSRLIEGKINGNDEGKPRISFRLGETDYLGLCDVSSTINIMSYSFDEGLRNNLNDPDLELTYTTIILSNMTLQYSRGVLHDPYILV